MRVRLKKHASRVDEAISLASYLLNGHNYETEKYKILEKYHFNTFDISSMMDQRSRIARFFQRDFQTQMDSLYFFFASRSHTFSLAQLLTKMPYFQAEKRRCRVIYDEDEDRVSVFIQAFKELKLVDESTDESIRTFEELSVLLERVDVKDEDKWLLQNVYLHLLGYLKRFCALVNQMVDWLMGFEEQICKEETVFYDYWQTFIEANDFAKHLKERLNVAVMPETTQIWIVPSYFACTRLFYEYQQENVLYVHIGMILDQSFSFEKKYETPLLLCSHLKVLSDPSKFEILKVIKKRPYYGSELAKMFRLSTPTISHHMQALENAGFVKSERRENKTFYTLDTDRLRLFLGQIHHMLLEKGGEV